MCIGIKKAFKLVLATRQLLVKCYDNKMVKSPGWPKTKKKILAKLSLVCKIVFVKLVPCSDISTSTSAKHHLVWEIWLRLQENLYQQAGHNSIDIYKHLWLWAIGLALGLIDVWLKKLLSFDPTCCVFFSSFGCCVHPKAGWTTFVQLFSTFFVPFKPFSVISRLKSTKKVWKWTKKWFLSTPPSWSTCKSCESPFQTPNQRDRLFLQIMVIHTVRMTSWGHHLYIF